MITQDDVWAVVDTALSTIGYRVAPAGREMVTMHQGHRAEPAAMELAFVAIREDLIEGGAPEARQRLREQAKASDGFGVQEKVCICRTDVSAAHPDCEIHGEVSGESFLRGDHAVAYVDRVPDD